ncbi:MAG: NUDIX domain-containing protein [Bacteroidia bacterium]|nr:NUDIX domain-containing protein [Bacteroidia bacterium]
MTTYVFCPVCGKPLRDAVKAGLEHRVCPDEACGFVHWDNPVPVVAAIVERGDSLLLVRSIGWPDGWYALVTGFLEKGETPEDAVLREVQEETGLKAEMGSFVGVYPFFRRNQLLLVYHVTVPSDVPIVLDTTELVDYREVRVEQVQPWPMGTGIALRDWLRTRGYEREFVQMPGRV